MARFVPDIPQINILSKSHALAEVSKLSRRVENSAKRQVRVDSGRLRTSIGIKITETRYKVRARVGSNVRHALVEHDGAKPHVIVARRKKALSFYWDKVGAQAFVPRGGYPGMGHMVFRGRNVFMIGKGYVNHPGTSGTFYLTHPLVLHGTELGFRVVLTPRVGGDA